MRNGKGLWKGIGAEMLYVGDWKNNKAHGFGTYTWPNGKNLDYIRAVYIGDRYDGEWNCGLKHGKGADFFVNGDKYVGDYINGKPCGEGTYNWKNDSQYEGTF